MALGSEVSEEVAKMYKNQPDAQAKEWLLSMRCICIKKKVSHAYSEFVHYHVSPQKISPYELMFVPDKLQ